MLTYIPVIPARERIDRGEPLNLLGGVANDGDAVTVDISVWGRVNQEWVALATQKTALGAHEHKHLYFTLTPDCCSFDRWQQDIEDIELCTDHQTPAPEAVGTIVFIED